jgi:hypothetical protein
LILEIKENIRMIRKVLTALVCLTVLFWFAACTFTGGSVPATPNIQEGTEQAAVTQTAAAQTVVANLTAPPATVAPGNANPAAITATLPSKPATAASTEAPKATDTPAPTNTPQFTPTITPSPTRTPSPTATFAPADIRSRLGEPTWREEFAGTDAYNWYTYEDKRVRFQASDGKLNMMAFEPNNELGWALSAYELDAKFYAEMDFTPLTCGERDRYGLLISPTKKANRSYMFDFSCDGQYSFWIWDGVAEEFTSLIPWTKSEFIRPGANRTNRLGLLVDGNKFYLYANGNLLTQKTNDRFDKIYLGIMIGGQKTKNFTVISESLSYWVIKE